MALRQRGDVADAVAAVRLDDGRVLMDRARTLIADMRTHEDGQLQARAAKMRRNLDVAIWVDAVAGLALLGLGVILFAIHRDLARRQDLEQALRAEARFQEQFIGILSLSLTGRPRLSNANSHFVATESGSGACIAAS